MSQLRYIFRLVVINMGNAFIGGVTTVAMAWLFGTTFSMQCYYAASAMLNIAQRFFLVGQFSDNFLPEYVQRRERDGTEKADRCFSALYNHLIAMLILTAVVIYLLLPFAGDVIAPGFSEENLKFAVRLAQGLLPVMCMVVANGHLQLIGNARGWFGRFEVYGLIGSVVGLVLLIVTGKWLGVWALLLSQGATQIVLYIGSWSYLYRQGYRHAWIWSEPGFSVWAVCGRVGLSFLYIVATQCYVVAFNAALTLLPGGTFAVYKYAETLYTRLASQFMQPVGVVFFTDAAILAHRNPLKLRARISEALYQYGLMYFCILAVLCPALANLIGALWGSPRYPLADIQQTVFFAWCFFGLFIIDGVGQLYRRLSIIMGDMRWVYEGMTFVQIALAFAAPVIVRHWGVWGAASVLILNVNGMALTGLVIVILRRPQFLTFFPQRAWKLAVAVALPLAVTWVVPALFPELRYAGNISIHGKLVSLTQGAFLGGLGLGLGAGIGWLLGVEEIHSSVRRLAGLWQTVSRRA